VATIQEGPFRVRLIERRTAILAGLVASALATVAAAAPDYSVKPDDMTLGDPRAKVTVIEYASASCPHCARFNNEVFPAFKAKYVDTGQVRYVMREILTEPSAVAAAGFLTARCGGKDRYFPILDQIFRHQAEIYQTGDLNGVLGKVAKSEGLTEQQFEACVFDGDALGALNARVQTYSKRDDISGTPTFIINGKRYDSGEMTLAELDQAIAEARKAH
jgi:protein-disulfide isomerase